MKNLIKLPKQVAALMLTGAIPAVRLKSHPIANRQRFFVYATDEQVSEPGLPVEWLMETHNHQVYGNIPSEDMLPNGAFLGWIEVVDHPYATTSFWCMEQEGSVFRVVRPRIFDHPLAMPSNAYEDYLFEHLLDAIPVFYLHEFAEPMDWGEELELPVNERLFNTIIRVGKITLDIFGTLASCVLDENGELKKFKLLTLACGNRRRCFNFHGEIDTDLNENWEPILYPSLLEPCGFEIRRRLVLHCGDPLR